MSKKERAIASDLARVDAHVITPEEYEEIPEWTEEMFERADYYEGGKLVRRGRPRSEHPKVPISIRLSEDVLARFKASGPGWQSRIDAALKEWLAQHPGRP
ncbi:MAG TPA: BrnA antitoxin family protein [Beijerinckiaceae bacterium]|jgi:uncharacterized protein (DUF4415 family)|nr:BrnA antitoxin family protein [Beijerinckiaceae bacterium]